MSGGPNLEGVEVTIATADATIGGLISVPPNTRGIVVFAHGSGSSRFSPRNQAVAHVLLGAGLGTLLMDLLTAEEEAEDRATGHLRFDIELLGWRVIAAIDWLATDGAAGEIPEEIGELPIGCFGASTGAGAALVAAAERPDRVQAVVSRGGRPDLAGDVLTSVKAPTLLIVGAHDTQVLELNRMAQEHLASESRLEIVPGASHLFEEPGALERVAESSRDWFLEHLAN